MSDSEGKLTTAIVIGAGQRGFGYAHYQEIKPEEFQVIAVADPKRYQRERLQTLCNISDDMVFQDWREVVEREKFADCVMICTQDQQHKEPAVAFAKKGYHILLEKPMATTEEDCREIVRVCKENNVFLTVCHVLRYTPWVKKIKELIDSGAIGDVVNIQHLEPVCQKYTQSCNYPIYMYILSDYMYRLLFLSHFQHPASIEPVLEVMRQVMLFKLLILSGNCKSSDN